MKPHILLLPGFLNNANLFAEQIPVLSNIATVDVGDLTSAETIGGMAAQALEAVSEGRFILVGLSLGGYVAFEIMRQAPKRVAGLVLMDTTARPDAAEARIRREALIELAKVDLTAAIEQMLPQLSNPMNTGFPAVCGVIHSMAAVLGKEVFERQQRAIMARPDSRPTLPGIACRTLVICGEDDLITPPELALETAEGINHARLELVAECGHLSTLDQPGAVNRLLVDWVGSERP